MKCYLIQVPGFVKVGQTHNISARMQALQVANPHTLKLSYIITSAATGTLSPTMVETYIKQKYLKPKIPMRGEWFDKAHLSRIIRQLKKDPLLTVTKET